MAERPALGRRAPPLPGVPPLPPSATRAAPLIEDLDSQDVVEIDHRRHDTGAGAERARDVVAVGHAGTRVRFDTLSGEPEKGSLVKGRYLLERVLARGGMASVWQGVDNELHRPVAVKFMAPRIATDPQLRERFYREAMASAKLRTPHVVDVYEFGIDGITSFIVIELLEGEDLQTRLKREKRIDLEESVRIVVQCAKALRAAQKACIVHRDLKPSNIFLVRNDEDLVVKILDFGMAKMLTQPEDHTMVGTILGSPQYMSPEQAQGERIDHRSDLSSLAAIAFRMTTGVMPFQGKTDAEVLVKVCVGAVPLASQALPGIPDALDLFFAKAFQRNVDARFADATVLSNAFTAAVGRALGEPRAAYSLPPAPDPNDGASYAPVIATRPPANVPVAVSSERRARVFLAAVLGAIALAVLAGVLLLASGGGSPAGDVQQAVSPTPEPVETAPPPPAPSAAPAATSAAAPSSTLDAADRRGRRQPPPAADHKRPPRPAPGDHVGRDNWGY